MNRSFAEMPRQTIFNKSWLNVGVKDNNGDLVADWCESILNDSSSARCKVCHKTFSVGNMGFAQLMSHSDGKKHINNMKVWQQQAHFKVLPTAPPLVPVVDDDPQQNPSVVTGEVVLVAGSKGTKKWMPINLQDKVTKADILFAMKLADSNYSFTSFADIGELFRMAFVDSDIA